MDNEPTGDNLGRASVVLADDNSDILSVASDLLGSEFEIVGTFPDGESLLRSYEELNPDLVVLDISMGDVSGMDVSRRLLEMDHHHPRIVLLTVHEEPEFIRAAFDLGVLGYVAKARLHSDLSNALRAALSDRVFLSPNLHNE